ncbi:MAG: O-antigen ligase family protein [Gemmataceae bacterium]
MLAPNGPALLRRLILVLATALIVARPLVIGEDPGLSANLADPWGMVLTLFWLLAAAGWAAWRFWLRSAAPSRDREGAEEMPLHTPNPANWYGGLVQTALLITVALVFVSAEVAAAYKFPARLIAWEWLGLFVSFFVVRQLAVTPSEQHGLFAVVLAGVAALSVQGIYQYRVELPNNRQLATDLETFRVHWTEENPGQDLNDNYLEQLRQRALENNIFGPYAHPNSYAGFLVLGLPGLIGAVVVSRRMKSATWQTVLTACCAVLGLAALWLTHSRGALLGLVIAGVGVGFFLYRRLLRGRAVAVLIGLIVFIALVYGGWRSGVLTTGMGKKVNTVAQRLEYWQTTWEMIRERPWLGVGPGNFGENYTRLMPASSEEKIKDPHNFALETWATCGIFALLALLTALAGFVYRVVRELRGPSAGNPSQEESINPTEQSEREGLLHWEFYLGGMFGLVLGFVLRVNTASANSILTETYSAAVRSVAWFAAFALLERLAWTERGRLLALTTGIAALLLNLCVSGGIGFPSVAGPLWIAVALALNAAALRPVSWLSRAGAAQILPLPIFLGVFLGYGISILYPVLASDGLVREAVQAVTYFQSERKKPPSEQSAGLHDRPTVFIQKGVIDRLEQAARLTPDDARIYVQLAWGTNVAWELNRQRSRRELPLAERALLYGVKAAQLDPHGPEGYVVQYQIRVGYAEINARSAEDLRKAHGDPLVINERDNTAREQYRFAAQILENFLSNDPHDAALRFALWRAWSNAGTNDKARQQAKKALELDDLVTLPARKLTDSQRKQIHDWLSEPLP